MRVGRRNRVRGAIALGAAVAAALAVLLVSSIGSATSSATRSPAPSHTSKAGGFSLRLPPGWRRAPARLVPDLLDPREILSVGTFSMPVGGGGNCDSEPIAAVRQMKVGDALISVQEVGMSRAMRSHLERSFPPRPARFDLHRAYSPAGGRQRTSGEGARVGFARLAFRDHGRAFYALVYVKGRATRELRTQVAAVLAGLRFRAENWQGSAGDAHAAVGPTLSQPPSGHGIDREPPGQFPVRTTPAPAAIAPPPVADRPIDAERLRQLIVSGAAADFRGGTRAGPPRFGLCLRLGLRRALDDSELQTLATIYRHPGGQQLTAQALNVLAMPVGERCGGFEFVPPLVEASRALSSGRLRTGGVGVLGLAYGPYVGIARCPRPNSTRCRAIGFDLVLARRASAVSATIAGRPIRLQTPGPVPHDANARGRDWGGYLTGVDLEAVGSPFHIPGGGRSPGIWAGKPPVHLSIEIVVTRPNGRSVRTTLSRVPLRPGFG
jgi:hypothetical protein